MSDILVAGVGSPHGADRLGWDVIEALQRRSLPESLNLLVCRQPSELTPLLLEARRAIVVDAMVGEGPAGSIHIFKLGDLPQAGLRLSSHGLGLVEAVQLAAALGMPLDRLEVLALDVFLPDAVIQPGWVDVLVQAVLERLPVA